MPRALLQMPQEEANPGARLFSDALGILPFLHAMRRQKVPEVVAPACLCGAELVPIDEVLGRSLCQKIF